MQYRVYIICLCQHISICCFLCRDCAPGQRECDESIERLNRSIRDLDQASLAAISQSLQQRTEKSLRVSVNTGSGSLC